VQLIANLQMIKLMRDVMKSLQDRMVSFVVQSDIPGKSL